MCIKSDFEEIILKLATNWQSDKGFLLTSTFVPKGLCALSPWLYTCIKSLKMCIKSDFEEIILKLATNRQGDKGFDINICPQGVVCPCPGAIYIYKRIKIYTRPRCQVTVYRTTGPLVLFNPIFPALFPFSSEATFHPNLVEMHGFKIQ